MNVWIVCEGEGLPIKKRERLWRMGQLADSLADNGHDVLWWTSSFDHGSKSYLVRKTEEIDVKKHEKLILLHSSIAYKKNVSISRIVYHDILAWKFGKLNENYPVPDIIICSWATQQFAKKCVMYGKKHHVPVILDIRDAWPDYFLRVFPAWAKMLGRIILYPMHRDAARTLSKADVIIGVNPAELEWGLSLAKRKASESDRVVFISSNKINKEKPLEPKMVQWWQDRDVTTETWNLCLIGTLSKQGDYDTLIAAGKKIARDNPDFRLIIAGDGDERSRLEELAKDCSQIVFPGWLDKEKMESLLLLSDCGAYSYKNSDLFKDSVSNKVVQYFSAGLPVISSLEGFSKELIVQYETGILYKEGNSDSCASAIKSLIENEEQRKRMCKNSELLFDEFFESGRVFHQFIELFEEVIRKYHGE